MAVTVPRENGSNIPKAVTGHRYVCDAAKYYRFDDEHQRRWWESTGPLLSRVLRSANYDLQQEYLYMTLYKTLLLPFLGPYPHQWDSFITYSGIPVEYSINYQDNGPPTSRIGWEPVSHLSGTAQDPLNLVTVRKAVSALTQLQLKGFDTRLFHRLVAGLTVSDEEATTVDMAQVPISRFRNQVSFGLDLKGGEVAVKCYIYPALKSLRSGIPFPRLLNEALQSSDDTIQWGEGLDQVHAYLEDADLYNQYSFIGIDLVEPSKSRLKVYNTVQQVTWDKLEQIWTLGGRCAQEVPIQRGLGFAWELWNTLTAGTDTMAVGIWNYELTPGSTTPMPKWYFILHGQSDMENARAIVQFYTHLGWMDLADSFIPTFQSYFPDVELSETTTYLQYVSLAYSEKTGVYFSVYYHSSL